MQRQQSPIPPAPPTLKRTYAVIACATAGCLMAAVVSAAIASGAVPPVRLQLSLCSSDENDAKERSSTLQQALQGIRRDIASVQASASAEIAASGSATVNQLDSVKFSLTDLRQKLDRLSVELAELAATVRRSQLLAASSSAPPVRPQDQPESIAVSPKPKPIAKPKPGKTEAAKTQPNAEPAKKTNPLAAGADASASKAPPPPQRIQPNAPGDANNRPPIRVMSEADVRQAERDQQPMLRPAGGKDSTEQILFGIKPKKIFQDGRRIPPVKLERMIPAPGSSVQVYMFDELLSDVESDNLAAVHFKRLEAVSGRRPIVCFDAESTMLRLLADETGVPRARHMSSADFTPGTRCLNASLSAKAGSWLRFNWTRSTVFYPSESRFTAGPLADRFLKSMGLPASHAGRLDVTSHPLGQGFSERLDCDANDGDSGGIFAIVRVFLDTVTRGGEFHLPRLGIWLRPRKSRALLVTQLAPDTGVCEPTAAYNSSWVESGRAVTLTQRFHYATFPGIGQRPKEPLLPARSPDTPVVMCDASAPPCRWSDEWTSEHLTGR